MTAARRLSACARNDGCVHDEREAERIGQNVRLNISQLGAFSRRRAAASLKARERSNTGSAKSTPKSDIDLLARMQHLASVNCASHRMLVRSPTSCVPGPGTRARM